jgi:hypothetical protein
MNKLITTLSIIGFLGGSNISFAESIEPLYSSHSNKAKIEQSDKSSKSGYSESFLNLLKTEREYEKSRLKYHYINGLFLDFGDGKLSIDNLEKEIENKIKLCKKMGQKAFENDEENKLYARTIGEVWEKFEVAVNRDKKRLLTNEINIQNLRKKYKELVRQLNARVKYLRKALHGKENV